MRYKGTKRKRHEDAPCVVATPGLPLCEKWEALVSASLRKKPVGAPPKEEVMLALHLFNLSLAFPPQLAAVVDVLATVCQKNGDRSEFRCKWVQRGWDVPLLPRP